MTQIPLCPQCDREMQDDDDDVLFWCECGIDIFFTHGSDEKKTFAATQRTPRFFPLGNQFCTSLEQCLDEAKRILKLESFK
jgi:hypothetical protein